MHQNQNTQLAIHSATLPASLAREKRFDEHDALLVFARLATAYGVSRIADKNQRQLLVREWVEALGKHHAFTVNIAIGAVIRKSKFWPTISEVVEACEPVDYRTAEEKFGSRHARIAEVEPPFCREGRTEAEEIAHRTAECLRLRKKHGANFDRQEPGSDLPPKPASKADWVSDQLRAHAKKHGYWRGPRDEDSQAPA